MDPEVLKKHRLLYMIVVRKNKILGPVDYLKPELILNLVTENMKEKIKFLAL